MRNPILPALALLALASPVAARAVDEFNPPAGWRLLQTSAEHDTWAFRAADITRVCRLRTWPALATGDGFAGWFDAAVQRLKLEMKGEGHAMVEGADQTAPTRAFPGKAWYFATRAGDQGVWYEGVVASDTGAKARLHTLVCNDRDLFSERVEELKPLWIDLHRHDTANP